MYNFKYYIFDHKVQKNEVELISFKEYRKNKFRKDLYDMMMNMYLTYTRRNKIFFVYIETIVLSETNIYGEIYSIHTNNGEISIYIRTNEEIDLGYEYSEDETDEDENGE